MELAEELPHRVGRDADAGVAHRETHLVRRLLDREDDLPPLGELERVREQVQEDLPHALHVGPELDRWLAGLDPELHLVPRAQAVHLR